TSLGTVITADADPNFAGTQVVVSGGTFTFQVQSPLYAATPTLSALAVDGNAAGSAANPATLTYTIAATRRFDFNGTTNATAAGQFTAVTLTGVDTNSDGVLTVTISESVIGGQWVANGLDAALGGVGSLPGAAPQLAANGEAKGAGAGVPQLSTSQLAPVVY